MLIYKKAMIFLTRILLLMPLDDYFASKIFFFFLFFFRIYIAEGNERLLQNIEFFKD